MSNGRNPRARLRIDRNRDAGGFIALPWSVVDSPSYENLSHPARSLLIELARQYVRDNNGQLVASRRFMARRGWRSADTLTRARRELIDAGFIFEMVKGRRPNRATWFALSWFTLDSHRDYDEGAAALFERGAYRKNTLLKPSGGPTGTHIAPSHGQSERGAAPSRGPVRVSAEGSPVPSGGHPLELPSVGDTPSGRLPLLH